MFQYLIEKINCKMSPALGIINEQAGICIISAECFGGGGYMDQVDIGSE